MDDIRWPSGVKPRLPSLFEVGSLHPCISPPGLQASGEAPVSNFHLLTGVLGLQVLLPLLQLTLIWALGIQTSIISPSASILSKFFTRMYLYIICVVKIKRNQYRRLSQEDRINSPDTQVQYLILTSSLGVKASFQLRNTPPSFLMPLTNSFWRETL